MGPTLRTSEGNCPKCRQPLGISGSCGYCALADIPAVRGTCGECGSPLRHSRLNGYQCWFNPAHKINAKPKETT